MFVTIWPFLIVSLLSLADGARGNGALIKSVVGEDAKQCVE